MQPCTKKRNKNQNLNTYYIHSITEDWFIYISQGSQLLKNLMQLSWLFDYIVAFQLHPKVQNLSVQKWVLQTNGLYPVLMCLKKNGKMLVRLELKEVEVNSNVVIWVTDNMVLTTKEFRKYVKS